MPKHVYNEAFMLMKYRTEDKSETEVIWNSRDGITPFSIGSKTGKEMHHVDWESDKYAPDHKPQKGDRIFVDLTEAEARVFLQAQIDKYWVNTEYPMSQSYDSKEEAMASMLKHTMEEWLPSGPPHIRVVE